MINLTTVEIRDLQRNSVPATPEDGMIFETSLVTGGSLNVSLRRSFATTADRDAFVAAMPKSSRIRLNSPTDVRIEFDFRGDERTGTVNEAAGKRLRSVLKNLAKLEVPVTHRVQPLRNGQPTIDEVLAMIDQPTVVRLHG